MLSVSHNVVPLLRSTSSNRALVQSAEVGFTKDLACLKELSLQLQATRRLIGYSADDFNALCTSSLQMNIAERTDTFLEEVGALQAGIDALISAMVTYQASA